MDSSYLRMGLIAIAAAVAIFILCWIVFEAIVAFGVLIALVIAGAAILGAFYLIDRRRIKEGPRF
jgi:hypothetical protein